MGERSVIMIAKELTEYLGYHLQSEVIVKNQHLTRQVKYEIENVYFSKEEDKMIIFLKPSKRVKKAYRELGNVIVGMIKESEGKLCK